MSSSFAAAAIMSLRHFRCLPSNAEGAGNWLGLKKEGMNPLFSRIATPALTLNLHKGLAEAELDAAHAAKR